jgi:hypothetical protein
VAILLHLPDYLTKYDESPQSVLISQNTVRMKKSGILNDEPTENNRSASLQALP